MITLIVPVYAVGDSYFGFANLNWNFKNERAIKIVMPADYTAVPAVFKCSLKDSTERNEKIRLAEKLLKNAANMNGEIFVQYFESKYNLSDISQPSGPLSSITVASTLSISPYSNYDNSSMSLQICCPFSENRKSQYDCYQSIKKFIEEIDFHKSVTISFEDTKLAVKNPESYRQKYCELLNSELMRLKDQFGNVDFEFWGLERPVQICTMNEREVALSIAYDLKMNVKK